MVQQMRPVSAVRADSALIAATVVPAQPDALGEKSTVIIPAPRSFVRAASVSMKRRAATDVAAPFVTAIRRPGPRSDALWPAGAGVPLVPLARVAVMVVGRYGKGGDEDQQNRQ